MPLLERALRGVPAPRGARARQGAHRLGRLLLPRGDSPYGEWRIVDDEELARCRTPAQLERSAPRLGAVRPRRRRGRARGRRGRAQPRPGRPPRLGHRAGARHATTATASRSTAGRGAAARCSTGASSGATLVAAGGRYDNRFRTFPAVDTTVPWPSPCSATSASGSSTASGRRPPARIARALRARRRRLRRAARPRPATTSTSATRTPLRHRGTRTTTGTRASTSPTATSSTASRSSRPSATTTPATARLNDDRDQLATTSSSTTGSGRQVEAGSPPWTRALLPLPGRREPRAHLHRHLGRHAGWASSASSTIRRTAGGSRTSLSRSRGPRWRIVLPPPAVLRRAGAHEHHRDGRAARPAVRRAGVRLVLSGHEHNFQHASSTACTTSSAARRASCGRAAAAFEAAGTRAWAAAAASCWRTPTPSASSCVPWPTSVRTGRCGRSSSSIPVARRGGHRDQHRWSRRVHRLVRPVRPVGLATSALSSPAAPAAGRSAR